MNHYGSGCKAFAMTTTIWKSSLAKSLIWFGPARSCTAFRRLEKLATRRDETLTSRLLNRAPQRHKKHLAQVLDNRLSR